MKTVKNASSIFLSKISKNKKIIVVVLILLALLISFFFLLNSLKQRKQRLTCVLAGCSNQLCVSSNTQNIVTTCEWKEEYKCYQEAKCELQKNRECGFTKDEKFRQCMKSLAPKIQEVKPL